MRNSEEYATEVKPMPTLCAKDLLVNVSCTFDAELGTVPSKCFGFEDAGNGGWSASEPWTNEILSSP